MKVTRQHLDRLTDSIRNLLYPMIPIFGIAVVWVVGLAGSLESKVNRELGPYARKNVPILIKPPVPDQPAIVSADPQE